MDANFPPFRQATCPRPDCQEHLKTDQSEEGDKSSKVKTCLSGLSALIIIILNTLFPSDYNYQVRKEIADLIIKCSHRQQGCPWEGRLEKLEKHLNKCQFAADVCPHCRLIIPLHKMDCPKAQVKCPFAKFGCNHAQEVRFINY